MNLLNDYEEFSRHLIGSFTKTTDVEVSQAWEIAKDHDLDTVKAIIDSLRLAAGSQPWHLDQAKFAARLRDRRGDNRTVVRGQKTANWIRDSFRLAGEPVSGTDYDVIRRHFSACWSFVKENPEPQRTAIRAAIRGHAMLALVDSGFDAESSNALASEIVECEPNQRLMKFSDVFGRGNQPKEGATA